jgi:hypothetical protein
MKLHPLIALSIPVTLALALMGCPQPESTDTTPTDTDPSALEAPPSGEGVQIEMPDIKVNQGDEVQNCYFYKVSDLAKAGGLPEGEPVNLHHIQIAQRDGSHHLNVFRVRTISGLDPENGTVEGLNGAGECFKSPNWADWPLVANSQQDGNIDWEYPEGVANVLQPDEWLMVQTHWVNATSQKTPASAGKARINLRSISKDQVKAEMGTIFATKQSIRVCQSNPTPEYSGTCQINSPDPVTIIGANGHFHSRGKKFDMYVWDGTSIDTPPEADRFYQSQEWDDPPMLRSPELNVQVPKAGGVFYTCSYDWVMPESAVGCTGLNEYDTMKYKTPEDNLDCCYTFGPVVEKNEHCNIFVYYYPKQDDIICQ